MSDSSPPRRRRGRPSTRPGSVNTTREGEAARRDAIADAAEDLGLDPDELVEDVAPPWRQLSDALALEGLATGPMGGATIDAGGRVTPAGGWRLRDWPFKANTKEPADRITAEEVEAIGDPHRRRSA